MVTALVTVILPKGFKLPPSIYSHFFLHRKNWVACLLPSVSLGLSDKCTKGSSLGPWHLGTYICLKTARRSPRSCWQNETLDGFQLECHSITPHAFKWQETEEREGVIAEYSDLVRAWKLLGANNYTEIQSEFHAEANWGAGWGLFLPRTHILHIDRYWYSLKK